MAQQATGLHTILGLVAAGMGVAVECSTVSPTWIRELARLAESADRCVVEAPMIGSRPQVEARALVHLAGGPEAALDRARDVLVVSATRVHHCGGFGTAATPNFPVELVAKDLRYLRDLAAEVAAPRP